MRFTVSFLWGRWHRQLRSLRRLLKAALHKPRGRLRTQFLAPRLESLEPRQVMTASFVGGLLPDSTTTEGVAAVYRFTIAEDTVPLAALTVTAASDNAALLSAGALALTDFGAGRWQLTVSPPAAGIGTTNISLTVSGDGAPIVDTFRFDIIADPNPYSRVSVGWFTELQSPSGSSGASASASGGSSGDGSSATTDGSSEWIVRLTSDALQTIDSVAEAATALAVPQLGITVVAGLGLPGQLLLRGTATVAELQQYFSTNTSFAYFNENVTRTLSATPNDPSYASLYGLNNTGQTGGTVDADIDAPEAWNRSTGSRSIVVGVIDTGIDYNHLDLAANIWTNPGEVAGNGIDDDANGFIDDIHGYDFVNNDGDPMDDHYHGTHVAGTIGAVGDNGVGVAGVNWAVSMMGLKFLNSSGSGTTANAIRAVNYATMMHNTYGVNIRMTSNSWGGGGFDQGLLDAINAGGASNILFIAAAGNDGANIDPSPSYPASYNSQYIVSVAATDNRDALASFSNYGATSVDLAAPGVNTYSTAPGNSYQSLSGTSMATPHVSGVAALALSVSPNLNAVQLKAALMASVDVVPGLVGKTVTGGRINADKVLAGLGLTADAASPMSGSTVTTAPTSFVINFSEAFNPASVSAADLQVNGIAADSFTLDDSDTVTFTFNTSPVTTQGVQTMTMAAGAVLRGSDADPLIAFNSTFRYDATVLAVISSTPANGATVSLPFTTLDIVFNEAIDPASIGIGDIFLSQGSVTAAAALNSSTIRYTLSGITTEGAFSFTLAAGALTDLFGNSNAAASGSFAIDIGTVAFPVPLSAIGVPGGLVYQGSTTTTITAGDSDSFTINVEAGQKLTVVVNPNVAGLRPVVELRDPAGNVVAAATAGGAGQKAVLQTVAGTTGGTYTIVVSGAAGTTGSQTVQLTLNADIETESHDGATNDSRATAQNIDAAFTDFGGGTRAAVLGTAVGGTTTAASETFESGSALGSAWTTYTTTGGQISVGNGSGSGVHGGAAALYMDNPGGSSLNEAILTVNLAGQTQATLSFWQSEQNDEESGFNGSFTGHYNADGVAISADGTTWYPLWSAVNQTAGVWTQYTFNLATAAAAAGISFNSAFKIKFQQYDDFALTTDGRGWDDITVTTPAPADQDWYSFTLAAGDSASLVLKELSVGGVNVQLYDSSGNLIVGGAVNAADGSREITRYVAPVAGTYYAAVTTNTTAPYELLVVKNAEFANRRNTTTATAQVLSGASGQMLGALSQNGGLGRLYIYDYSASMIREINSTTGAIIRSFASPVSTSSGPDLGLATSSTSLIVGGNAGSPIYELNPDTGAVIRTIANPSVGISGLAYRNGELFARTDSDNIVRVFDFVTGALLRSMTIVSSMESLAAGDDYLYAGYGSTVYVLNPLTGATVATKTLGSNTNIEGLGVIGNEIYASDYSSVYVYDRTTFVLKRALSGLNDMEAVGADGGDSLTGVYYAVTLNAGSVLHLSTSTPGDAAGEFVNSLDPSLSLYNVAGTLVASNADGAADGRNAVLDYTATQAGTYYILVSGSPATGLRGEYALSYSGAVAPTETLSVVSSTPAAGTMRDRLTSLTLLFNDTIDRSSVAADDLLVNGVAATGVVVNGDKSLTFTFAEPPRGNVQFTLVAGALTDLQQTPSTAFSLLVNYQLNGAPVLNGTPAPAFTAILEDELANAGMLVADLLATGAGGAPISDPDAADLQGIAITAVDTSKGSWEYSLNNGSTWTALGSVSATSARLLAADAQTRIRLKPAANAFGTVASALTFKAWDQTAGANGGTANASISGGATAFSTASAVASLNIVGVNDAPSFSKGSNQTVPSDGTARTVSGWASSISQGAGETGQTLTFLVTNDNNSLFLLQPTISSTGVLTYRTVANAKGTATVSVRLQDDGGLADGGSDTSAVQTFTITMSPPPSITAIANQTILEDGSTGVLSFIVSDPDAPLGSLTVTTSSNNSTLVPAAARVLTNLGNGNYQLVVTPAANQSGTSTVTVTVSNGTWSTSTTFTLTVTAVNDAPTFTKGSNQVATMPIETTVNGWATGISSGPSESQTLTFVATVDDPTLFTVLPTITAAGQLKFTAAAAKSGTATVTVYLSDNGGTAGGGVDRSAAQTFTIQVSTLDVAAYALDPTFGTGGILKQSWTASQDYFYDVATQADGKFIVVGLAGSGTMAAARYLTDGTLDTTFGTNGRTTISSGFGVAPVSVVMQADGKILVASQTWPSSAATSVFRLNSDGTLDTTFGTGGGVTIGTTTGSGWDVVAAADGSIYVVNQNATVYKLSSAGTLLWTSSGGGYTAYALAQQADGKLIVGGSNSSSSLMIGRIDRTTGAYDTTFGTAGRISMTGYSVRDVLIQSDGKIIAIATPAGSNTKVAVLRFNANGSVDTTYGTAGAATYDTAGTELAYRGYLSAGDTVHLVGVSNGKPLVLRVGSGGAIDTIFDSSSPGNIPISTVSGTTIGPAGVVLPGEKFMFFGADLTTTTTDLVMMRMYRVATNSTITPIADTTIDEDGVGAVDFSIADVDTPLANLTVSVTSDNSTLLPASGLVITDLGNGDRRLTLTPAADRFGTVRVTIAVSDGGVPTKRSFLLTVNPVNDAPSFVKGSDLSVSLSAGSQTVAGWATAISQGSNETGQALTFVVTTDNDSLFTVPPTVSAMGTLTYTTSGVAGTAVVSVRLKDNGGTASGGSDTSAVQTFTIVVQPPPRVLTSSIQKDDVLGSAFSYVVTFDRAMNTGNLDASDFKLHANFSNVDLTPTGFRFDAAGTTLTLDFTDVWEDSYTLTLLSGNGRFEDALGRDLDGETAIWPLPAAGSGNGVDGGDFVVSFSVDNPPTPIATPLTADVLAGSLIYRSNALIAHISAAGDFDDFTIQLDAGQSLSIFLTESAGLRASISIFDPNDALLGTYTAAAAGTNMVVQGVPVAAAGTYKIRFAGAGGSTGQLNAAVTLNAVLESESRVGPANGNDSRATAQNLDGAFNSVDGAASRAAVVGGVASRLAPAENFESGTLGSAWSTYTSLSGGRTQVSAINAPHGGSYALFMDTLGSGYTLNEAVWTVDLAGAPQAVLKFWHAAYSDEDDSFSGSFTGHYNADGVAISADGNQWFPLWSPVSQSSTWAQYSIDLVAAAATAGISLNSSFKIKFQQYDNFEMGTDGRGWDDITITPSLTDVDYYSLTLAAGESVSLALQKQAAGTNLQLSLQDAAGNVVAAGPASGVLDGAIANFRATIGGTYYVVVTGSQVVGYDLVAVRNGAFDVGANDTVGAAQNVGAIRTVVGFAGTDDDYYAFQLAYHAAFTLATSTPGDGPNEFGNRLDPALELYDAAGTLIASNADGAADGRNAKLTAILTAGTYKVRVVATNGTGEYVLTASDGPASAAPVVAPIADAAVNEDGTATIDFHVSDSDTALGLLTIAASTGDAALLPQSGLTLTNLGDGDWRLVAKPAADRTGTAVVTLSVSDGSKPITLSFNLTVAPVNDAPSFTKGADQASRAGGAAVTVAGWASAISTGPFEGGQSPAFDVTTDDSSLFLIGPAISAGGTLTYTSSGRTGTATVTVVLRDDGGTASGGVDASAPQTFTIKFDAAPIIDPIAAQSIDEEGMVSVNIHVSDADTPLGSLVVTATSADQTLLPNSRIALTSLGNGDWRLTASPAADRFGSTTVTVSVGDGTGTPATRTFDLTVVGVNDAPSFTPGGDRLSAANSGAQSFTNWATSISAGPNESSQSLTFDVVTDNPALFTVGPQINSAGTLTYTPSGVLGTADVTVVLRDNGGTAGGGVAASTPKTFKIQISLVTGDGMLDSSFDGDGIVSLPSQIGSTEIVRDVARQADGKYLVAAYLMTGAASGPASMLTRFNTDGTVDTTFGVGGSVQFTSPIRIGAVEVLSNGKIIVGGESSTSAYVARLNSNGGFDTTFGLNGSRTLNIGSNISSIFPYVGMAIQADGSIVLAKNYYAGTFQSAIVRFTASGAVDTTFNGSGYSVFLLGASSSLSGYDVIVQSDGKLVMAGTTSATGSGDFFAARFTTSGLLDTSFGAGLGYVTLNIGTSTTSDTAQRVVQQADGKLIIGGTSSGDFALIRLNADGTLDTTFSSTGKVVTNIVGNDILYALALQTDGKIVAAGSSGTTSTTSDMSMVRYTTNGALDAAFDGDGKYTRSLATNTDQIQALLIEADGKFVAAGTAQTALNGGDLALARFNTDLTLDTTFNGVGYNLYGFGLGSTRATASVGLPDGRVLFGGFFTEDSSTTSGRRAFWMLRADGSVDTSFGTAGYVIASAGSGSFTVIALAVQSDGKFVFLDSGNRIGRFNADGSTDSSFGTAGLVAGTPVSPTAMKLQANGAIVIAGARYNSTTGYYELGVARYTAAGVLDTSFSGVGYATADVGTQSDYGMSLAVQADDKLVVGGYGYNGSNDDFALVRFNVDGTLDTTFSGDGKVLLPIGASTDRIRSVFVQRDGKILVGGNVQMSTTDIALARFNTDGTLDTTFSGDGIVVTPLGTTGTDDLTSVLQTAGGKLIAVGTALSQVRAAVVRYLDDGSLDTTFDSDGILLQTVTGGAIGLNTGVIDSSGRLIVSGYTDRAGRVEALTMRYLVQAAPNTTGPSVDVIADRTIDEDTSSGPIAFSVSHSMLPPSSLTVTVVSGNTTLFTAGSLVLTNLGNGNWQLTATPAADGNGSALITVRVSDGSYTYAETFTINVRAIGDAPIVDLNGSASGLDFAASFVEDAGPAAIVDVSALTVVHPDGGNLTGAVITLTDAIDGAAESLAVDVAGTPLAGSYAASVLTLSGAATTADYQKVLRTLTYVNTSHAPHTTPRHVTITVTDGVVTSTTAHSTITVAPVATTITGVYARGVGSGSVNWSASFLAYLANTLDASGRPLGDATLGYMLSSGGTQLKTLPWTNVNTLSIRFSEDIAITRDDLEFFVAAGGPTVPGYSGFVYDVATSTATWTFAGVLPRGKFLLHIGDTVVDAGGTALDGEWNVASSTTSGDGTAGGDFNFRFNVLPGDFDGSNGVTITEVLQGRNRAGKGTASAGYLYREDVDGSGGITITEVLQGRNRAATSITGLSEPVAPGSTPQAPWELALLVPGDEEGDYVSLYAALTEKELAPLVEEAVRRWEASGLVPQDFDWSKLRFATMDLGPAYLGLGNPDGSILLDDDGAGWGWFVDGTPSEDDEFACEFAAADPLASSRMDLLTVVMHEIGHALGYPTGAAQGTSAETLMSELLAVGTRRTPGVATPPSSEPVPSDILADDPQTAPPFGFTRLTEIDFKPLAFGQVAGTTIDPAMAAAPSTGVWIIAASPNDIVTNDGFIDIRSLETAIVASGADSAESVVVGRSMKSKRLDVGASAKRGN